MVLHDLDGGSAKRDVERVVEAQYNRTESHGHLVGHPHSREPEPDSVGKAELEAA
jgi:hypothetical protein